MSLRQGSDIPCLQLQWAQLRPVPLETFCEVESEREVQLRETLRLVQKANIKDLAERSFHNCVIDRGYGFGQVLMNIVGSEENRVK